MTEPAQPSATHDAPRVDLPLGADLWERAFAVAPLVLVTTKEGDGWDVAPKHMVMPLGWDGHYCFACTPAHATYRNVQEHPWYTISLLGPEQVLPTALAAGGRAPDGTKPSLAAVETAPASAIDGRIVAGSPLTLELELVRVVDGFGRASLIVGRVVAASARPDAVRAAEVDDADLVQQVGLLAYVHPGRFAVVRETHGFPLPVDFHR
jgi:flavin reductase (DIM6/NTAB) family NADH-FMN oxidoreductase RutF